jgi:hypothetical protein
MRMMVHECMRAWLSLGSLMVKDLEKTNILKLYIIIIHRKKNIDNGKFIGSIILQCILILKFTSMFPSGGRLDDEYELEALPTR